MTDPKQYSGSTCVAALHKYNRVGERLMVGDDVIGVRGNQVKFGINAPKEVAVHREEIYARIKAEERQRNGTN